MTTTSNLTFLALIILAVGTASPLIAAPVEITLPEMRGAMQPQVAVAPAGAIHVVFGKKETGTIYHVASRDGGRTFSKTVQVAELPKLALGMRRGPRIVATDKVIAVSAISHDDGNVHAWTSGDGGATWKESAPINDNPKSAREGLHAMTADAKGAVFATWLDLRNKGTELWGAASADGGVTWGTNALIYKSPDGHICECCHPSAAMDAQGRIAVMWRNWLGGARDMYAALSSDGGKTFSAAQKLGAGTWKLDGCPMDGGAIALNAGGQPLTTWRRGKSVYATGGTSPEQQLADSALQSIVTTGKGGTYYLWQNGDSLMLKQGAADAVRLAERGAFPAAAPVPNRGPVVVWESPANGANTILAEVLD